MTRSSWSELQRRECFRLQETLLDMVSAPLPAAHSVTTGMSEWATKHFRLSTSGDKQTVKASCLLSSGLETSYKKSLWLSKHFGFGVWEYWPPKRRVSEARQGKCRAVSSRQEPISSISDWLEVLFFRRTCFNFSSNIDWMVSLSYNR